MSSRKVSKQLEFAWQGSLTSDEEIALWENGDHQALVESVLPYILKLSSSEDNFQNNVVEVLRCLESFDPHKGRLTTYLTQRLRWRQNHEQKSRTCRLESEPVSPWTTGLVEVQDEYEKVCKLLDYYSVRDQDVFIKHYMHGVPFDAIAQFWRMSKSRVYQVCKQMMKEIRSETRSSQL